MVVSMVAMMVVMTGEKKVAMKVGKKAAMRADAMVDRRAV